MPQINLKIDSKQLSATDYLAGKMSKTRTAYIREAIAQYNAKTERNLLARKFAEASARCRNESMIVNEEMEAADFDLSDRDEGSSTP